MARLPDLPTVVRPLTNEQARWLDARFPDLPRSPERCITCRGAKTFRWYNYYGDGDKSLVVDYDCNCDDQYILHRVLLHCGIGTSFQRLGWLDFRYLPDDVRAKVFEYLDKSDAYVSAGIGMIFYGNRGNGKSLLAALMLKGLLAKGNDVYYTTFATMLDTWTSTLRDKEERLWFTQRVRNAGILALDDVGREAKREEFLTKEVRESRGLESGVVRRTSVAAETTFEEVIRHRVAMSKPTIVTTNLDIKSLEEGYGGNVISLLSERSTTCPFKGEDRREEMRVRLVTEVADGLTRPVVLA